MIHDLSLKISNKLVKESDYESEVIAYGVEITIRSLIKLVTILLIGFLINDLILIIIVLVSFSSLRLLSGGFHFSRFFYCYINSMSLLTSIALASQIMGQVNIAYLKISMFFCFIISIFILLVFGTSINPDRASYNHRSLLKYLSITFIIIMYIFVQYILGLNPSYATAATAIQLGIVSQSFTLLKRKRGTKNEKN